MLGVFTNALRNGAKFIPFGVLCVNEINSSVQKYHGHNQCQSILPNANHCNVVGQQPVHDSLNNASELLGYTFPISDEG